MSKINGTLIVHLIDGYLTRDTEAFGKMDPFVEWQINKRKEQILRSKTHEKGGKLPKWDQKFAFRCQIGDQLNFTIFDEEKEEKHDLIGQGEYFIKQLQVDEVDVFEKITLQAFYKGKTSGTINVEIQFLTDNKPQKNILKEYIKAQKKNEKHQQLLDESNRQLELQKLNSKSRKSFAQKIKNKISNTFDNSKDNQKEKNQDQKLDEEIQNLKKIVQELEEQNKNIMLEKQKMIQQKQNVELQIEIIKESLSYNEKKQEILNKYEKILKVGELKGCIGIENINFEFLSSQSDKGIIAQVIMGVNGSERWFLKSEMVECKALSAVRFKDAAQYSLNGSAIINVQVYNVAQQEEHTTNLLAISNYNLIQLKQPKTNLILKMYNHSRHIANLSFHLYFQDS